VITDADGHFTTAFVAGDEALLTVLDKGYAPEMKDFKMPATEQNLTIQLTAGHKLMVKDVDATSRPVPSAYFITTGWRGKHTLSQAFPTNASGEFIWPNAPVDAVEFQVQDRSGVRTVTLTASDKEIVVGPPTPARLHGTVTDAVTGKRVEAVYLSTGIPTDATNIQADQVRWIDAMIPVPEGQFDLRVTVPDLIVVRAVAKGYASGFSRVIRPGETDVELDLKLTPIGATTRPVNGP